MKFLTTSHLQGKKMFGRSHVRSVAEKRMGPISAYCQVCIVDPVIMILFITFV